MQKVVLSDKSLGKLVAQCKLEFVIGLVLLCRAGPRILTLTALLVALAFLKLRNALGLGLCPRIVIVRGQHVEPIDATIFRMMVRAPRVLCTLVNVGRAFLGDLPLGAASLGGLRAAISGVPFSTAFLLRIAATLLIARERNTLGQFANAFPNLLERRGESNDLGVLLVRSYPGAISDHVPVHLVEPFDDVGG